MTFTPITPPMPLVWPPVLSKLKNVLSDEPELYIVGGAVRDAALRRPLHDIDFTTSGDGCAISRKIANRFAGDYYPLDRERGVGRALFSWEGTRITIDVARFRGDDLLTDLMDRDFTINAMAVALNGDLNGVIDPTRGLQDLQAHIVRQCQATSIANDPVRSLRAVRASVSLDFRIEPSTIQSIKECVHLLPGTSIERIRDELFNLLGSNKPATALAILRHLGILAILIPETIPLSEAQQGPPHQFGVWKHTLATVDWLNSIVLALFSDHSDTLTANLQVGGAITTLSHLREPLRDHIGYVWPNGRTHRALLSLAALLHDVGKPATRAVDADSRVHFLEHEHLGAKLAAIRGEAFHLSNDEIQRLTTIIRHHMRPHWLNANKSLTPRAIYRYWRDTGPAGVDICLLAMADYLATYDIMLDSKQWMGYLQTIQTLLTRYYMFRSTAVYPQPLLDGTRLLKDFKLSPGPIIGEILEQIREAQVSGIVSTQQEALDFVRRLLNQKQDG